jgi:protein TonB
MNLAPLREEWTTTGPVVRPPELVRIDTLPLSAFHRPAAPPAAAKGGRLAGAAIAVLAHVFLVAVILYAGTKVYQAVQPPEPITVALLPEVPNVTPPRPAVEPTLVKPDIPIVAAPEITIAAPPARNAITVQQVKNPAPATPPAPQVSGTARDTYLGRIIAHLDAAKHYPPQARRLHIEGVVLLHFIMDRTGHVLSYDIAKSSGRPILDGEVRSLISRAQPLPPIPADWPQSRLDLEVPVEFSLH